MTTRRFSRLAPSLARHLLAVLGLGLLAWLPVDVARAASPVDAKVDAKAAVTSEARSLKDWLMRMHDGSRTRAYVGTLVVSSGQNMSSARIWHVCRGGEQVERVELLTGPARSVFRHNDQMLTFLPDSGVVRVEKRESIGLFPELVRSADSNLADFYVVKTSGQDRVAGVQADVVQLLPRDRLRLGYKVWAEQTSGLVVKLQTLALDGQVLEQVAFSELQLDAPVNMDKLLRMMRKTDGYRLDKPELVKTSAQAQGWFLRSPVPGFKPVSCHQRTSTSAQPLPLHCVYSDGLASVSVFMGTSDAAPER